ncbi:MAG: hypothetical protein ABTQ32_12120 [Myxococcaceae bacterium]
METLPGLITRFDPSTGEGTAKLEHGDVRFSRSVVRGGNPIEGLRVRVGELGPEPGSGGPLSDTFAMRAGFVEPASAWPELPVVHVVGLETARRGADSRARPVAQVPFDASAFPGVSSAFTEALVGPMAFSPPTPVTKLDALPAHLSLLADSLRPLARRALVCTATEGDGESFVAGDVANIGDVPWPTYRKKPMMPLLQVGANDARRFGLSQQVNVFISAQPTASNRPELAVLVGQSGARRKAARALAEQASLSIVDEVPVYPEYLGLQSALHALGQSVPLDLRRFVDLPTVLPDGELGSIQADISQHFPASDELEADVVLGGFSSTASYQRLACLSAGRFPWLRKFQRLMVCLELRLEPLDVIMR